MINTLSQSEVNVTVLITVLYAQPTLATVDFIKELFPTFNGNNWEEIEQRIVYRSFIGDTEYYMCERIDNKDITEPGKFRRVIDDEFVALD